MRERDRLKLLAIKNNSENYWSAYKMSRSRVTQALQEAKAVYYKRQFVCVKNDPKQAWKTVNKILNRNKKCGSEINCIIIYQ
jgi:biopolymer transport protein ExbD